MKFCEFGGCQEEIEDWKNFCVDHFRDYKDYRFNICLRCGNFKIKEKSYCDVCAENQVINQSLPVEKSFFIENNIFSTDKSEYPHIFLDNELKKFILMFYNGNIRTINLSRVVLDAHNWRFIFDDINFVKPLEKCFIMSDYYVFGSNKADFFSSLLLQNKEEQNKILVRLCILFIDYIFPNIFDTCDYTSWIPSASSTDHMEHIAKEIADFFNVECYSPPIKRTSSAHSRTYSWETLGDLFVVDDDVISKYEGDKIFLIDDIITRGRSINNIRRIFSEHDISSTVFCLAKTYNSSLISMSNQY